jgi:uncharacterized cupin superfamily protein
MPNRKPVPIEEIPSKSGCGYPESFHARMGVAAWRELGDHFGLTKIGVSQENLAPGAESSVRHWHTLSDEFILVTEGQLVLRTDDGEFVLGPGMCIGFKAGERNAHHLVNRSALEARFIVVGSRTPGDSAFYPDDDLAIFSTEGGRVWVHKDGRRY